MDTILGVLGESSVRAIAISVAVACILWGMRVKSPAVCHRAWTGVLLAMLFLPMLSLWAPRVPIPLLPPLSGLQVQGLKNDVVDQNPSLNVGVPTVTAAKPNALLLQTKYPETSRLDEYQTVAIFYLIGFCILTMRLLAGMLLSYRLTRNASRDAKGFCCSQCAAPLTVGLFFTRILLPLESQHWDSGKLDAVLTHEKEHMRRHDPLVEWLALLNRCIYWFHPLAWWLCSKLAVLAEQACDEAVIARGYDRNAYAEHLLEFARSVKQRGSLFTAWGSSFHGSKLAFRIRRIVTAGQGPAISRVRLAIITAFCAGATLIPAICDLARAQGAPFRQEAMLPPAPRIKQPDTAEARYQPNQSFSSKLQSNSSIPSDKILYKTALAFLERHQYKEARQAFHTLINYYPYSHLAAFSYLAIGESFYDEGGSENLRLALESYVDFAVFFPHHPKAADAQMKAISINLQRMRASGLDEATILRANAEIDRFLKLFPNSAYVSIVRQYREEVLQELAGQGLLKVTGHIVDPAAHAIPGVTIALIDKESNEVLEAVQTNDSGCFVIPGVPLEKKIELRCKKDGFESYFYAGSDLYSSPLSITMHPNQSEKIDLVKAGNFQQDLLEQPLIERIDVRGNRRIPGDTLRFYIHSKPGDPFDKTRLEFDMRALYQTNFFESIEIQEKDGHIGKIITFIVKEKPIIRTIEYIGNKSFTESDILDAYRKNKTGLVADSQYEPKNIKAAERILKDLMIQHGKPRGTVHTEIVSIPPNYIQVRFVLDEDGKSLSEEK